jgi:hypothetical protein
MQQLEEFNFNNQIVSSSNDEFIDLCDGYRFIDGCYNSYEVGFSFLSDGTIDISCFLDIDGNEITPDCFEREYVESKLIRELMEECTLELEYECE